MRIRNDVLTIGVLAWCVVGCSQPSPKPGRVGVPGDRLGPPVETPDEQLDPLVRKLRAESTRLKAFHELAKRNQPDETPAFDDFSRNHRSPELIVCPQPAGTETVYVLLYEYLDDYSDDLGEFGDLTTATFPGISQDGPHKHERKRDLAIDAFTASGRLVTPFDGNNVVSDGLMCDINGDGFVEGADHTRYGLRNGASMTVLEVQRVAEKAELLFAVAYNGETDDWHYDFTDEDADGALEIALGPRRGETVARKATYVWDPATRTYVGPEGASGDHYRVINHKMNVFLELMRIALDGGIPSEKAGVTDTEDGGADEDGGFGVSVTTQYGLPREQRDEAASATPYAYSSLSRLSDEEIARWMGRQNRQAPATRQSMLYDSLPPGFWDLPPREAALKTVELNRSAAHKAAYALGIADGEPPETGTVFYFYDSDASYTAHDAHWSIYVGTDESYLTYASVTSQGIVGHDYSRDVEQANLCRLQLDPRDARHLLQTLWWFGRVRTKSRRGRDSSGGVGYTSADGDGYFEFRTDGAPGIHRKGRWWAGRLIDRFGGDYCEDAFVNFADFVIAQALPDRLGEAWAAQAAYPSFWDVGKEEFVRQAEAARKRVAPLVPGVLAEFSVEGRRVSADVAGVAALIAGQEAMTELGPRMKSILASLPPVPEYLRRREDANRKRWQIRRTPGWEKDPKLSAEAGRLWEEFWHLLEKTDPRDEALMKLRGRIGTALKKMEIAHDTAALRESARKPNEIGRWALRTLKARAPERYLDALEGWVAHWLGSNADSTARQTFALLTNESKPRALAMARSVPAGEVHALSVPVFALLAEAGSLTQLDARIGVLLDIALERASGWELRGKAIQTLVPAQEPLRYADGRIDDALVRLLDPKLGDDLGNYTLADACQALARRRRSEVFDRMAASIGSGGLVDARILRTLVLMARRRPGTCRPKLLPVLQEHLTATSMDVNEVLLAVWGADLRELKGRVEELANGAPGEAEGPLANCSTNKARKVVGRYQRARMIASLWNEKDPLTRAKLAVAFNAEVCWPYCSPESDEAYFEHMRDDLGAAGRSLEPVSLSALREFITWYERLRAAPLERPEGPREPDKPLEFAREALGFAG
jgi:hypothetical protein